MQFTIPVTQIAHQIYVAVSMHNNLQKLQIKSKSIGKAEFVHSCLISSKHELSVSSRSLPRKHLHIIQERQFHWVSQCGHIWNIKLEDIFRQCKHQGQQWFSESSWSIAYWRTNTPISAALQSTLFTIENFFDIESELLSALHQELSIYFSSCHAPVHD